MKRSRALGQPRILKFSFCIIIFSYYEYLGGAGGGPCPANT